VSFVDDLKSARDNLAADLKAQTALWLASGGGVNHTIEGESVDWQGWLAGRMAAIQALNQQIAAQDTPFELVTRAY
jgi:hypothetical protein